MNRNVMRMMALALPALLCGMAKAQGQLGTLACTTVSNGVSAGTTSKVNVSYYAVGVASQLNIGSQSGGAGAGKVTFQPRTFHTGLANFQAWEQMAANGTAFSGCTLLASAGGGTTLQIQLSLVQLTSATAVGSTTQTLLGGEIPTGYTEVTVQFGGISVTTLNGRDDGGTGGSTTTIPGGWNRVTNTTN